MPPGVSLALNPANDSLQEMTIMWNRRKYATAIAGVALAAVACSPVSAQYGYNNNNSNGYSGVFISGWPYAPPGAGSFGPNGVYGYGGPYRAASYGDGSEDGRGAVAPAPEQTRPIIRRRGPRRLE
jgi:hypothetical protein